MARKAVSHTLSALAAVALIFAFTCAPGSAQGGNGRDDGWAIGMRVGSQGLAAQRPTQRNTTTHYQVRWWQDYGAGRLTPGSVQKGLSLSDEQ